MVFLSISLLVSAAAALRPDRGLLDFGAFYMAGEAQRQGLAPYGVYPEVAEATGYEFGHTDDRGHSPNLNPPISLYPFRLLAAADPAQVKRALNLASTVLFAACFVVMLRAFPRHRGIEILLVLASAGGFWYTIWLGQIYVLLFALGLGAWLLMQRGANSVWAGLLIGLLIAVKPNFAFWPLLLLLAGHPKVALTSFSVAAGISAIPLLLEGPGIYGQWLEAAQGYSRLGLPWNASLVGQAQRLGVAPVGYALSAFLVVGAALLAWRTRPAPLKASSWGIVVALLATPISWLGYGLLALPVLLSRRWGGLEWAVAIGMTGIWSVFRVGEPAFAATLLLLILLCKDELAASSPKQSKPADQGPQQAAA